MGGSTSLVPFPWNDIQSSNGRYDFPPGQEIKYGKTQSAETVEAIKLAQIGIPKPRFICPYCSKSIGGKANYNRYHGEKCSINTI